MPNLHPIFAFYSFIFLNWVHPRRENLRMSPYIHSLYESGFLAKRPLITLMHIRNEDVLTSSILADRQILETLLDGIWVLILTDI